DEAQASLACRAQCIKARFAFLNLRVSSQRLAVTGKHPSLKRLPAARELDRELDRMLGRADLPFDIVFLTILVGVIRARYLAILRRLELQSPRAAPVVVELVAAIEIIGFKRFTNDDSAL